MQKSNLPTKDQDLFQGPKQGSSEAPSKNSVPLLSSHMSPPPSTQAKVKCQRHQRGKAALSQGLGREEQSRGLQESGSDGLTAQPLSTSQLQRVKVTSSLRGLFDIPLLSKMCTSRQSEKRSSGKYTTLQIQGCPLALTGLHGEKPFNRTRERGGIFLKQVPPQHTHSIPSLSLHLIALNLELTMK